MVVGLGAFVVVTAAVVVRAWVAGSVDVTVTVGTVEAGVENGLGSSLPLESS